jgi:hypothetical protein
MLVFSHEDYAALAVIGLPSSFNRRIWDFKAAINVGLRLYLSPNSFAVCSTIGAILR